MYQTSKVPRAQAAPISRVTWEYENMNVENTVFTSEHSYTYIINDNVYIYLKILKYTWRLNVNVKY